MWKCREARSSIRLTVSLRLLGDGGLKSAEDINVMVESDEIS
jgi:hypothetical protein